MRKITEISKITKKDNVLEIGTGIGTLTEELALNAKKVLAFEVDEGLREILKETLPCDNVKIIFKDVLKANLKGEIEREFGEESFKVAANLPYYITTPIITMLIKENLNLESITCMIQKEIAQRMVEKPNGKNYSSFSVFIQTYTEPVLGATVPPTVFMPRPKVESQIVLLKLKGIPVDPDYEKIVRGCFQNRRKTLINSLNTAIPDFTKEEIEDALNKMGLDKNVRAQELSVEDFLQLKDNLIN